MSDCACSGNQWSKRGCHHTRGTLKVSQEEAQKMKQVFDKLSEGIGHVAPGNYSEFYADYNTVAGILTLLTATRTIA